MDVKIGNIKSDVDKLDIDKLKNCSCWFKQTKYRSKQWCC